MKIPAPDIELAHGRLKAYLLGKNVQLQGGELRGAVAGTVSANGEIDYVYGEITGYYLHWLASLHDSTALIKQKAQAAHDWLGRLLQSRVPATRIYLHSDSQDWRNEACFAFDLAMIAGGLACAIKQKLLSPDPHLLEALVKQLNGFVDNERLLPVLTSSADCVLPQRWSTLGGPFSAKTASRILMLRHHGLPDGALAKVCQTTLQKICAALPDWPPEMLHPTLYALEGCLLYRALDVTLLATAFEAIALQAAPDGSLPEALATPEVRRSDIVAQALRIGVLLHYRGALEPGLVDTLDSFADCLAGRVSVDGSIAFNPAVNTGANIWSGMFAEQALRLYLAMINNLPEPLSAEEIV